MYCSKCGAKVNEGESFCSQCGESLNKNEENNVEVVNETIVVSTNSEVKSNNTSNTSAVPMDSFAIAGFALSLCGLSILGLIFSAVSYSRISKGQTRGRGFALAGLIISVVSMVAVFLYIIFILRSSFLIWLIINK